MDIDLVVKRAARQVLLKSAVRRALDDAGQLAALVDVIVTYYPPDHPLRLEVEQLLKGMADES